MKKTRWRKFQAGWRNTGLLLRVFQKPLLWFVFLIAASGTLYFVLAYSSSNPVESLTESFYHVLTLTFLQPTREFPQEIYLQIFYFILPFLGIGILAQGLAEFGVSLFNKRARSKEWQMAVASTYHNHMILVGLGHLGFRVALILHEMGREVVVLEQKPKPDLAEQIQDLDVPIIVDDATRERVLLAAGIQKAKTIILCTQNDSLNLEIGVKARSLNPSVEVVIRIFDDDFARSLQKQFGFKALSATGMAAPVFAASAANVDITPPITIEGQPNSLARFEISANSIMHGKIVDQIETAYDVSVVLVSHDGVANTHPDNNCRVASGDILAVLGSPEQIARLVQDN